MIKDLHDIDDLFRSGLDTFEETPSTGVKERIDAILDKKAAGPHKKRVPGWKRTALLLLMLLSGFIIYETGLFKTGWGRQSNIATGKQLASPSENKHEETNRNKIVSSNADSKSNDIESSIYNKEVINGAINNNVPLVFRVGKKEISGSQSEPAKDINDSPMSIYFLPVEKISPPLFKTENETAKINDNAPNSIKQLQATIDSVLKYGTVGKSKESIKEFFRPRWMITGYASYDQAGYQLDSDEPSAITSVKHQEAHEPSFSLGLLITRQLTNRWGLQSGIIYSNSAIGMKPQKTYAFKDPTGDIAYKYITSFGYAFIKPGISPQPLVGDSLTTAEAKHTMENIIVPLAIKYTLLNKKISITPGAGIEANFITKANLEVEIEDAANSEIVFVRKLNGTKSFYWSFVVDADLRYNLNKKLSLTVRPAYRHALSPVTKYNVVETFPYSFGLGVGLTIKF